MLPHANNSQLMPTLPPAFLRPPVSPLIDPPALRRPSSPTSFSSVCDFTLADGLTPVHHRHVVPAAVAILPFDCARVELSAEDLWKPRRSLVGPFQIAWRDAFGAISRRLTRK